MLRTSPRIAIATFAFLGSVAISGRLVAQAPCPPLPPPTGPVIEVQPSQVADLLAIVADAATGTTILLHDGTYDLDGAFLYITNPGLTLRSAGGDREAVVLDGGYVSGELISIQASNTTIADLTLQRAYYHAIHVSGPGTPISGVLIHNVHIIDPGEQAVKVNAVGEGTVDDSAVQCSRIELTDAGRLHIRNDCYTGGLDAHAATGWRVWRNHIEGFWCEYGLSEHGIHMWRASADTVVEENVIVDCARGIGFGLGSGADGHTGGIIRNNFVAAADGDLFASEYGFDAGIALWGAEGAAVYHNTDSLDPGALFVDRVAVHRHLRHHRKQPDDRPDPRPRRFCGTDDEHGERTSEPFYRCGLGRPPPRRPALEPGRSRDDVAVRAV